MHARMVRTRRIGHGPRPRGSLLCAVGVPPHCLSTALARADRYAAGNEGETFLGSATFTETDWMAATPLTAVFTLAAAIAVEGPSLVEAILPSTL